MAHIVLKYCAFEVKNKKGREEMLAMQAVFLSLSVALGLSAIIFSRDTKYPKGMVLWLIICCGMSLFMGLWRG